MQINNKMKEREWERREGGKGHREVIAYQYIPPILDFHSSDFVLSSDFTRICNPSATWAWLVHMDSEFAERQGGISVYTQTKNSSAQYTMPVVLRSVVFTQALC